MAPLSAPHGLVAAAVCGILAGCAPSAPPSPQALPVLIPPAGSGPTVSGFAPYPRMPTQPPLVEKQCCKGQNECKGKGNCKTEQNSCKGQNECKGQGGCAGDCD